MVFTVLLVCSFLLGMSLCLLSTFSLFFLFHSLLSLFPFLLKHLPFSQSPFEFVVLPISTQFFFSRHILFLHLFFFISSLIFAFYLPFFLYSSVSQKPSHFSAPLCSFLHLLFFILTIFISKNFWLTLLISKKGPYSSKSYSKT